ncbi:MAG TPA: hypothetical protein VK558_06315 [Patescibacteria group bacterium]|nr:hypothetical protein [Patescibacteria group bacterium]
MFRRFVLLLGLLPALAHAPAALAGMGDFGPPAQGDAPVFGGDEALLASLANDGFRTFSQTLGKGYALSKGVRWTPYVEMGTQTADTPLGIVVPGAAEPAERFLIGGVTRYAVAPHWMLSVDLAAGLLTQPDQADQSDHRRLVSRDGAENDNDPVWRGGVRLGYAVATGFTAFTAVEYGTLQLTPNTASGRLPGTDNDSAETSLRLGFSYKF